MPTESDLLRWICDRQRESSQIHTPAGDDLAVARWDARELLLVGVDQVLDGVHFDSTIHSPRAIGRKVMNRNLSDCAAMACLPAYALISAALPSGFGVERAKELYLGIEEAARSFDCAIVGGDTGSWNGKLAVSVTILGRSAGIGPITRRGAKVGDALFVTGPLGGSILGRHMTFEPRLALAREIALTGDVHAMIDLSDGLSRDLPRICQASNVGAIVNRSALPVHSDAEALSKRDGISPFDHALHDGEDHELLFAADAAFEHVGCVKIGNIVERGIVLDHDGARIALQAGGWEHAL